MASTDFVFNAVTSVSYTHLIGIALTLPISSAAICIALSLDGLAGGAATAGCCAQMIGFAVMSYRENKIGGLMAQGLGTSMPVSYTHLDVYKRQLFLLSFRKMKRELGANA